jgi:site-specific DNA-methyltransferase (adenine-specific)
MHELTGKIGAHGRVNHGGAVSNWEAGQHSGRGSTTTCAAFLSTGKISSMPPYEDVIRPFSMDASKVYRCVDVSFRASLQG